MNCLEELLRRLAETTTDNRMAVIAFVAWRGGKVLRAELKVFMGFGRHPERLDTVLSDLKWNKVLSENTVEARLYLLPQAGWSLSVRRRFEALQPEFHYEDGLAEAMALPDVPPVAVSAPAVVGVLRTDIPSIHREKFLPVIAGNTVNPDNTSPRRARSDAPYHDRDLKAWNWARLVNFLAGEPLELLDANQNGYGGLWRRRNQFFPAALDQALSELKVEVLDLGRKPKKSRSAWLTSLYWRNGGKDEFGSVVND